MSVRVLVINDNESVLRVFEANLSQAGYHVETLFQAETSVGDIEQVNPDLVILGYLRGDLKAERRIIDAIRATPSIASLPIIVFTTDSQLLAKLEELGVGRLSFHSKPFDRATLLTAVREALRGPTGQTNLQVQDASAT